MFLSMSDLGQSTNMTQASNAYSKGRSSVSQGNMQIARLSLAELQFTYNNAKNAGNDGEAAEIYRLYGYLKSAIDPSSGPTQPAPASFAIDMSVTKGSASSPVGSASPSPANKTNPLLVGGIVVGSVALLVGGYWFATRSEA